MIFLRTSGADSNPFGVASAFVGLPVPVGVQNGDLALVGIVLPAAGVTVTPPDPSWTQIAQSDPAQAHGVVVFWKTTLSEQASWVFSLSSSAIACGAAAVYGGVDSFRPVEVAAVQLTAASASHGVDSVSPSLAQEELVIFAAGAANSTYATPAGFTEPAISVQTAATIAILRTQLQNAGPVAAFNLTFGAVAAGATVAIVLSPNTGTVSFADAYNRLVGAMPPGWDNVLDATPPGDFFRFFSVIAAQLKTSAFDLVDLLFAEIVPHLSRYKLPDWESFFGLRSTRTAQLGTIPQRQAGVLSAWRQVMATTTFAAMRGVIGPLLGYVNPSALQIIEPELSQIQLEQQYGFAGDVTLPGVATSVAIRVNDGGKVTKRGAVLTLVVSDATKLSTVKLTAPDGTSVTWSSGWSTAPVRLYAPSLAGTRCDGWWILTITTSASITLYDGPALFVDGVAPPQTINGITVEQQTGSAAFNVAVVADPALVGGNGVPPDYAAASIALQRLVQAQTRSVIVKTTTAIPSATHYPPFFPNQN